MTASDNGSGYLKLAHNNYGSGNGFTLSSTTQLGLTTGSTNSGIDAVASINGVSETGNGQTITWDESGQDFHGLSVKYTGTSTGSIGSLTLTLGVGELISRRLGFLTASDGYVTARQNNLQTNIDSLDVRMKELEERLTKQRERLINQFVAMENAMSKMQNISSWLSQQLGSISSLK
jgi:flagellar hook-associated protein 2